MKIFHCTERERQKCEYAKNPSANLGILVHFWLKGGEKTLPARPFWFHAREGFTASILPYNKHYTSSCHTLRPKLVIAILITACD